MDNAPVSCREKQIVMLRGVSMLLVSKTHMNLLLNMLIKCKAKLERDRPSTKASTRAPTWHGLWEAQERSDTLGVC